MPGRGNSMSKGWTAKRVRDSWVMRLGSRCQSKQVLAEGTLGVVRRLGN